jgi:hypothetical protein
MAILAVAPGDEVDDDYQTVGERGQVLKMTGNEVGIGCEVLDTTAPFVGVEPHVTESSEFDETHVEFSEVELTVETGREDIVARVQVLLPSTSNECTWLSPTAQNARNVDASGHPTNSPTHCIVTYEGALPNVAEDIRDLYGKATAKKFADDYVGNYEIGDVDDLKRVVEGDIQNTLKSDDARVEDANTSIEKTRKILTSDEAREIIFDEDAGRLPDDTTSYSKIELENGSTMTVEHASDDDIDKLRALDEVMNSNNPHSGVEPEDISEIAERIDETKNLELNTRAQDRAAREIATRQTMNRGYEVTTSKASDAVYVTGGGYELGSNAPYTVVVMTEDTTSDVNEVTYDSTDDEPPEGYSYNHSIIRVAYDRTPYDGVRVVAYEGTQKRLVEGIADTFDHVDEDALQDALLDVRRHAQDV